MFNAIIDNYFDKRVYPTSVLKYTCRSTYENREHILIIVKYMVQEMYFQFNSSIL
jgi:hypothetical protein